MATEKSLATMWQAATSAAATTARKIRKGKNKNWETRAVAKIPVDLKKYFFTIKLYILMLTFQINTLKQTLNMNLDYKIIYIQPSSKIC